MARSPSEVLPSQGGCYVLVLAPRCPGTTIQVGRRGDMQLAAGYYLYVGSAHGPGGLKARLNHHLTPATRPHWHVDYLRRACEVALIWFSLEDRSRECSWSDRLHSIQEIDAVSGFGASDCPCSTHLFHVPGALPDLRAQLSPELAMVECPGQGVGAQIS